MAKVTGAPRTRAAKSKIPQLAWDQAHPAAVVLVSGPEIFLGDRAMQSIRDALKDQHADLEVHDIDAAAYTAGELFTLASPSLFAEPRLIRVVAVEKCSDAFLDDAKKYVAEPAEESTLVLRHTGGQRGKALLDLIRGGAGGGVEVLCPEMKREQDRLGFVQAEFRRLGAQATPGAMRLLLAAYSGELGELAGACAQLVSDVGARITETEVSRATEGRVETNGFKVADAATAGKAADALVLFRQALSTGTDLIPMLVALNMKVRAMARVYGARGGSGQLARELGMAPWQVERAQREVRGWREADLARAVDLGAETEWLLKGGSRDPEYALERYLLFVARHGR